MVARLAVAALAVALLGAGGAQAAMPKSWPRAFRSCDALLSHTRGQALRVVEPGGLPMRPQPGVAFPVAEPGPRGDGAEGPQAAPAPAAGADDTGHSTTNVQEAGVDEPDLVKTDGRHVFAIAGGALRAIDVRGAAPKVVGTLRLDGHAQELLLSGKRLVVFANSTLTEIDVSDPANLRVVRTLAVEGTYVSARLTGRTARVVLASYPRPIPLADVEGSEERRRRVAIRRTRLKTWVPSYTVTNARTGSRARRSLVRCRATRRPAVFSGLGMLTVLTLDLDRGIVPVDSDGLLTDARTVYASRSSLYVASERWFDPSPESSAAVPPTGRTTVHRFDTRDGDHTTFRASGDVRGHLLNQWSLSEHAGRLRVATTEEPQWWSGGTREDSESFVTVLAERGGVLGRVGAVGGLGRGERIYAVRFIEGRGYVVTFRQVDPLYVLALDDPEKPRVSGELKILGYSAYLHPIGDDLLLGVGQDATEQGRVQGTQLSVFDVRDPARPARLHQRALGYGSNSEAEYDHHAFLWWAPSSLAVIPVSAWSQEDERFTGAIGFRAGRAALDEGGRVEHPEAGGYRPAIRRALVVGSRLFTVSDAGILASRLDTLGDGAFAKFE